MLFVEQTGNFNKNKTKWKIKNSTQVFKDTNHVFQLI